MLFVREYPSTVSLLPVSVYPSTVESSDIWQLWVDSRMAQEETISYPFCDSFIHNGSAPVVFIEIIKMQLLCQVCTCCGFCFHKHSCSKLLHICMLGPWAWWYREL